MQKYPFVKQEGNKDCGVSCLSMIIKYYSGYVPIEKLREQTNTDQSGVTAYHLIECAENLGLHAKGLKGTIENLEEKVIQLPIIVHVLLNGNYGHYLVVYEIDKKRKKLLIADPSDCIKKMSYEEFLKIWDGVFLTFFPYKKLPLYNKKFSFLSLLKNLALQYKIELFQLFLFSIFLSLFSILQSYFFQFFIDQLQVTKKVEMYLFLFYLFLSILLLKHITNLIRHRLLIRVNMKIDYFLHYDIYSALIYLPYRFYKTKTTGEVTSKMNDLELVKTFLSDVVTSILVDGLLGIVCFFFLIQMSLKLTLCTLAFGVALILIQYLFQPFLKAKIKNTQEKRANAISYMVESFEGFSSIKNLIQENSVIKKYMSKYLHYIKEYQKLYDISLNQTVIKEFLIDTCSLLILFLGILEIMNGKMTIGMLISFQMLMSFLLAPISSWYLLFLKYQEVKSSLEHITELFYEEEKIPTLECPVQFPIQISSLSYSFKEEISLLKNFSLTIQEGEKILFVGSSGSGKSTLMKLLLKYYPIPRTNIFFNQIDINDIKKQNIRNFISYVSQEETLFTETLWYNLTLGKKMKEEKVLEVCRMCEVDKIANQSTLGYFMILEENGFHLSGGEKERIILARAILQNRPFLIIDEGMGQMDVSLERRILKNIFEYDPRLTLIMVSHRMNNQDLFTRIIELENGKKRKDLKKNA